MQTNPLIFRRLTCLAILLVCVPARAEDTVARFDIAGGDQYAWVVTTTNQRDKDSQLPLMRISVARRLGSPDTPGVHPLWRTFGPIVGQVRTACADRERLYLQFGDMTFVTLDLRGGITPGGKLPGGSTMNAWVGDAAGDSAYAVVSTAPDLLASQPASRRATQTAARLARYDGQSWTMLEAIPPAARDAGSWSLAANDLRVLLVWVEIPKPDGPSLIRCAEWSKTGWGDARTLTEMNDAAVVAAGWPTNGPLLLVSGKNETGTAAMHLFDRTGAEWRNLGPITVGGVSADHEGNKWAVAHGRVLAARNKADVGVEVAWAAVKENPTLSWTPLGGGIGTTTPWWAAWLDSVVTLMMIGFLFFLRPDRLTKPAPLPSHLAVALPAKRLVAGVLDMVPAALLTAYWWVPPLMAIMARMPLMDPEEWQPFVAPALWGPKLLFILVYAMYCFAWEATIGTTPGKLLLGCRVVDESGNRPTLSRTAIRNAMRIPELAITFLTMATLFLMLVASMRRQRVADMLAGTLVVGHAIPRARPLGQHESGGDPPAGDGG